jgi:hypothetical protein
VVAGPDQGQDGWQRRSRDRCAQTACKGLSELDEQLGSLYELPIGHHGAVGAYNGLHRMAVHLTSQPDI